MDKKKKIGYNVNEYDEIEMMMLLVIMKVSMKM